MKNSIETITPLDKEAEFRDLYDQLVFLLNEQINCVQESETKRLQQLAQRSGEYVERIGMLKVLDKENYKNELEHLRGLYRRLCLSIGDQKQKTAKELNEVRTAGKTLSVYRKSI